MNRLIHLLVVVFVVTTPLAGTVGATAVGTQQSSAADVDRSTSVPMDDRSVEQEPVTVTERYDLTPEDPGNVTVTMTYDFGATDRSSFREYLSDRHTLLSKTGFDREDDLLNWNGRTDTASVTVRIDVNSTDRYGTSQADVGSWAFFRPFVHLEEVDVSRTADVGLTASESYAFLGPHDVLTRTGEGQQFRLVVPRQVSGDLRPDGASILEALERTSKDFDVGERDETVTAFAVPDPIRSGGSAGDASFWFSAPNAQINTVVHEYVHTRENVSVTRGGDSAVWLTEGIPEVFGYYYAWKYGYKSFGDYRAHWPSEADRPLAEEGTTARAGYEQGGAVVAALDYRIRSATDGDRSFEDVFRRLNERDEKTSAGDLQDVVEDVAGRSFDRFFENYVYGADVPPPPSDPAPYGFVETRTVEGTLPPRFAESGFVRADRTGWGISTGLMGAVGAWEGTSLSSYASANPDGDGHWTVTVGDHPLHGGFHNRWYQFTYVQVRPDGTSFPRDGVPDLAILDVRDRTAVAGTVNATPGEGHVVDVVALGPDGDAAEGATTTILVRRETSDGVARASVNTDVGESGHFEVRGDRGLEIQGAAGVWATTSGTDLPFQQARGTFVVDRPTDVLVRFYDRKPEEVVPYGLAVPADDVVAGRPVNVTVFHPNTREDGTIPVYVDGERRTRAEVDSAGREQSVTVQVRFEDPGDHTVSVGEDRALDVHVVEPGPTTFAVRAASVETTEVEPGGSVEVNATVANVGESVGRTDASVAVDGTTVDRQPTWLEPGESTTVSYTITLEKPGDHEVTVAGERVETVTVTGQETATAGADEGGSDSGTEVDDGSSETPETESDGGPTETRDTGSDEGATVTPETGTVPGFGAGLAVLVVLFLAVGYARRR